eukprot:scaffold89423_cov54-Phaeocystis_antarctica.AAC.1
MTVAVADPELRLAEAPPAAAAAPNAQSMPQEAAAAVLAGTGPSGAAAEAAVAEAAVAEAGRPRPTRLRGPRPRAPRQTWTRTWPTRMLSLGYHPCPHARAVSYHRSPLL